MPEYFLLSHPLRMTDPRPPAIPAPSLETFLSIRAGDAANGQILRVANHTGTHVDAPAHVIEHGATIHDFPLSELIYTRIVFVPMQKPDSGIVGPEDLEPFQDVLSTAEIALFDFGFGPVRKSDPGRFSLDSPGFGVPAAEWIRDHCPNLRALGMDVPSFSVIAHIDETMAAHNVVLGQTDRRVILIEDMKLENAPRDLSEVRVNPWLVEEMDSAPCTVIGVRERR
jgi:arylformamidase